MKKILLVLTLLTIAFIVAACGGSGLRDGTYVFGSSNIPREDFTTTDNIWIRFSEHENGITIEGNRIRSGSGGWYQFQIVDSAIEVRRRETSNWSSTPYRVRGRRFTIEFGNGERVVTLTRR